MLVWWENIFFAQKTTFTITRAILHFNAIEKVFFSCQFPFLKLLFLNQKFFFCLIKEQKKVVKRPLKAIACRLERKVVGKSELKKLSCDEAC
jgi:hypothetical protein